MWGYWSNHLQLGPLFDQVDCTSRGLTEVLAQHEALRLTRLQQKSADEQVKLAGWQVHWGKVAAVFVPFGLALAIFSVLYTAQVLPPLAWLWQGADSEIWFANLTKEPIFTRTICGAVVGVASCVGLADVVLGPKRRHEGRAAAREAAAAGCALGAAAHISSGTTRAALPGAHSGQRADDDQSH